MNKQQLFERVKAGIASLEDAELKIWEDLLRSLRVRKSPHAAKWIEAIESLLQQSQVN